MWPVQVSVLEPRAALSWVKLDDSFPDHPKVIGLSVAAKWAYVEALCYCARYLTDGAVPASKAKALGSVKIRAELFCARLWIDCGDGDVAVHDYLAYNPTRAKVLADRETEHANKVKAGLIGAKVRWQGHNNGGSR